MSRRALPADNVGPQQMLSLNRPVVPRISSPQVVPGQDTAPAAEPIFTLGMLQRIGFQSAPRLSGRQPAQMLVRADVVVKEAELNQSVSETGIRFEPPAWCDRALHRLLERPEESLDAPIHPERSDIGALMPDAKQ